LTRFFAMIGLALLALVIQGALAMIVPPPWCPDLALIVVIAIGLCWRGLALGLCLAAALGFAADLVSGSLMGQHALLRLIVFASAFFAGRQLNLRGSFPLCVFTFSVSVIYGFALYAVSLFFIGRLELGWSWVGGLLLHSFVNALVAPALYAGVTRLSGWASEEEGSTRTFHIDPRRGPA